MILGGGDPTLKLLGNCGVRDNSCPGGRTRGTEHWGEDTLRQVSKERGAKILIEPLVGGGVVAHAGVFVPGKREGTKVSPHTWYRGNAKKKNVKTDTF